MGKILKVGNREICLMKSYSLSNYKSKTVLTNSIFDFIELWLMRDTNAKGKEALFYWRQAKNFYESTLAIPIESKPLTAYYCCMNATKALLAIRNVPTINISHGVTASRSATKGDIASDEITFLGAGVLFELSRILGDPVVKQTYKLQDLFYNLVCIHRTFTITFSAFTELFIPISEIEFENIQGSNKVYAKFTIDQHYANGHIKKYIPTNFEIIPNDGTGAMRYRCKKRFDWDIHTQLGDRIKKLNEYHKKIRRNFYYICSTSMLLYIKKHLPGNPHIIDRSSMSIIYGILHWLSELVRYNPSAYSRLLSSKQNWLIKEFMDIGLTQFIDEISSEITGLNIMSKGYKSHVNR